jgi:hypothetical protein
VLEITEAWLDRIGADPEASDRDAVAALRATLEEA